MSDTPISDIFGCPENVLGIEPSRESPYLACIGVQTLKIVAYVCLILVLVSAQVLVILGQDWLRPSFFLPKSVRFSPRSRSYIVSSGGTVKVYDYHPPMPTVDTEAPKQSLGDCAICMEPIVVHPESTLGVTKGTSAPLITLTSTGIRRLYALAPSHHVFVSHRAGCDHRKADVLYSIHIV